MEVAREVKGLNLQEEQPTEETQERTGSEVKGKPNKLGIMEARPSISIKGNASEKVSNIRNKKRPSWP